ncbi:Cof-type HAD-IIB family hydrolase [Leucobacter allii]|uniref:Cof-type HAD-IIB family hydrolase n=1 Tax=Leucobacter allii TaxID=2932247 RepID=UPI001FD61B2B|nr:Cof-type HAD-IIB family hydrolase [Leucobacter allii]UOR02519.1 Cof-type HAD-IIB family hydrolase [Leucobacter allii]
MIDKQNSGKATAGGAVRMRPSDAAEPVSWSQIPPGPHDVRLVVTDLDGTLLTEGGRVPETFWPLLEIMRARKIAFAPASGRHHAALARLFDHSDDGISYIADNGNLVIHAGRRLSSSALGGDIVRRVVSAARDAAAARNLGVVVSGLRGAYVERTDRAFTREVERYYAELNVVDDLASVEDDVLKVAVYDFSDAQTALETTFRDVAAGHQAVISGKHWLDIMRTDVDKGSAVRALQNAIGVSAAHTVVFGDYLNDLQMLGAARWSFAMSNSHPQVQPAARYVAPAFHEDGVVSVLRRLLDVPL